MRKREGVKERLSYQDNMLDVTGADEVEIMISDAIHGLWPVIHIATRTGTKLRICQIKGKIIIKDERRMSLRRYARNRKRAGFEL